VGCARVAGLRPGSVAHTSDALSVGDYLTAVNGVRCERLRAEQVATLLQRAEQTGNPVALELRYPLPPPSGKCLGDSQYESKNTFTDLQI
jgi:S1-C subfamily serine protease